LNDYIDHLQADIRNLERLESDAEHALRSMAPEPVRVVEASNSLLHALVFLAGASGVFLDPDQRWRQNVVVPLAYRIWRLTRSTFVLLSIGRADGAYILLRAGIETVSLLLVVSADAKIAKQWAEGQRLPPKLIRKRLSQASEGIGLDTARSLYSQLCDFVHANASIFDRFPSEWRKVEPNPIELLSKELPHLDHHNHLAPILPPISSLQLSCSKIVLQTYHQVWQDPTAAQALRIDYSELQAIWTHLWNSLTTLASNEGT
jgi:hypothetical protein